MSSTEWGQVTTWLCYRQAAPRICKAAIWRTATSARRSGVTQSSIVVSSGWLQPRVAARVRQRRVEPEVVEHGGAAGSEQAERWRRPRPWRRAAVDEEQVERGLGRQHLRQARRGRSTLGSSANSSAVLAREIGIELGA